MFDYSYVLFQVYLMYGLIMAVSVTFTTLCVTIQRRHLMVSSHYYALTYLTDYIHTGIHIRKNQYLHRCVCVWVLCWLSEFLNFVDTICVLNLNAGVGSICSQICFWCGGSDSVRLFHLFGITILYCISVLPDSKMTTLGLSWTSSVSISGEVGYLLLWSVMESEGNLVGHFEPRHREWSWGMELCHSGWLLCCTELLHVYMEPEFFFFWSKTIAAYIESLVGKPHWLLPLLNKDGLCFFFTFGLGIWKD